MVVSVVTSVAVRLAMRLAEFARMKFDEPQLPDKRRKQPLLHLHLLGQPKLSELTSLNPFSISVMCNHPQDFLLFLN